jgi:hypothetical protein
MLIIIITNYIYTSAARGQPSWVSFAPYAFGLHCYLAFTIATGSTYILFGHKLVRAAKLN